MAVVYPHPERAERVLVDGAGEAGFDVDQAALGDQGDGGHLLREEGRRGERGDRVQSRVARVVEEDHVPRFAGEAPGWEVAR